MDWVLYDNGLRLERVKRLLEFTILSRNGTFDIHNTYGIKLLTTLGLGLNYFNEHKFKYGFDDKIIPICIYHDIESINHFSLSLTTSKALI